jgi:hypothetical protein
VKTIHYEATISNFKAGYMSPFFRFLTNSLINNQNQPKPPTNQHNQRTNNQKWQLIVGLEYETFEGRIDRLNNE